jgi:hypothetical protein
LPYKTALKLDSGRRAEGSVPLQKSRTHSGVVYWLPDFRDFNALAMLPELDAEGAK